MPFDQFKEFHCDMIVIIMNYQRGSAKFKEIETITICRIPINKDLRIAAKCGDTREGAVGTLSLKSSVKKINTIHPRKKAYEKLQDLLSSRQVMKDVRKLSPGAQTSCLEVFHAVVNHFAPKLLSFSYHGMQSRLLLAALHYNENGQRDNAYTRDGDKRTCVVFPKYKKGDFTVRDIKVDCTFGYVHKLFETIKVVEDKHHTPDIGPSPPPLSSQYEKPRTEDIHHVTRY